MNEIHRTNQSYYALQYLKPDDLVGDQVPGEEGEDHGSARQDQGHAASPGDGHRGGQTKLDRLGHLLAGLVKPVLGPEEGKDESLGEISSINGCGSL